MLHRNQTVLLCRNRTLLLRRTGRGCSVAPRRAVRPPVGSGLTGLVGPFRECGSGDFASRPGRPANCAGRGTDCPAQPGGASPSQRGIQAAHAHAARAAPGGAPGALHSRRPPTRSIMRAEGISASPAAANLKMYTSAVCTLSRFSLFSNFSCYVRPVRRLICPPCQPRHDLRGSKSVQSILACSFQASGPLWRCLARGPAAPRRCTDNLHPVHRQRHFAAGQAPAWSEQHLPASARPSRPFTLCISPKHVIHCSPSLSSLPRLVIQGEPAPDLRLPSRGQPVPPL